MNIITSLENPDKKPLALTIGNFDGVHIGHQAIIKKLIQVANDKHLTASVMTFSPHAKIFFGRAENFLINSDEEKAHYLHQLGIETVFQIPFDQSFSQIQATDFIDLLISQLNVKYLLVGDDFNFGYKSKGNFELLKTICEKKGVIVHNTPTIIYDNERVSSSRVRQAITDTNFELVNALLGRALSYSGTVISDRQLGRKIDFPTANVRFAPTRLLPNGVFASFVKIENDSQIYQGMSNIGIKPTVSNDSSRQIETHIFDFSDDLYGKRVSIRPIFKLRDERKFDKIELLTEQLRQDKKSAISYLKNKEIQSHLI